MTEFNAPRVWHGESLLLRPYEDEDATALREATLSSYEHLKTFMPWATQSQTLEQTQELIAGFKQRYAEGAEFVLGIWDATGDRFLGGTGFHLREGPIESLSAEIGMWVRADEAGRGTGKAVLAELIRWGFCEWPWLRLSWLTDSRNTASIRCAEFAGMTYEGTLRCQHDPVTDGRRDTACYAILKSEWS